MHQGILQMTINLPQAVTPAFTTSTFAVSVDRRILGGNLHWVIFFVLSQFHIIPLPRTILPIDTMLMLPLNDAPPIQLFLGRYTRLYLKNPRMIGEKRPRWLRRERERQERAPAPVDYPRLSRPFRLWYLLSLIRVSIWPKNFGVYTVRFVMCEW